MRVTNFIHAFRQSLSANNTITEKVISEIISALPRRMVIIMNLNREMTNVSERYERLRAIAREVTMENISHLYQDHSKIMLTEIDSKALQASVGWLDIECSRPRAEWSWKEAARVYRKEYTKRFEVAIWHSGKLCGLSYGRPSYGKTRLRIELIEGAPRAENSLGPRRVVPITIMNATAYAGTLGAKELRIMSPAPGLIGYYESLDFTYVETSGARYLPGYLYKMLK